MRAKWKHFARAKARVPRRNCSFQEILKDFESREPAQRRSDAVEFIRSLAEAPVPLPLEHHDWKSFQTLLAVIKSSVACQELPVERIAEVMQTIERLAHGSEYTEDLFYACVSGIARRTAGASPRALATCAHLLAKRQVNGDEQRIPPEVIHAAANRINQFPVRELARMMWAFASTKTCSNRVADKAVKTAVGLEMSPVGLVNIFWSVATLRVDPSPSFMLLASRTQKHVNALKAQELSNVAWAIAKVNGRDASLMSSIADVAAKGLSTYQTLEIVNLAWAFATTRHKHDKFVEAVYIEVASNADRYKPEELANLLWAFTHFGDARLFGKIEGEVISRAPEYSCQNIATIVWSFAKMRIACPNLWRSLSKQVHVKISGFKARELSMLSWSAATLEIKDPDVLDVVLERAHVKIGEFSPQGLANLAWSLATLSIENRGLTRALAEQAVAKLTDFNPQNVANFFWACAKSNHDDPVTAEAFVEEAANRTETFKVQELSNLVWAFSKAEIAAPTLCATLGGRAAANLPACTPQNLANMSWALARQGCDNPALEPLVATFGTEAASRRKELKPQELASTAWALAACQTAAESIRFLACELFTRNGCEQSDLSAFAMAVIGGAWALNFTKKLTRDDVTAARAQIKKAVGHMDIRGVYRERLPPLPQVRSSPPGEPYVALDLADRMVIFKPPDWEIDYGIEKATESGHKLSDFVRSVDPSLAEKGGIAYDTFHTFGFCHRLDIPSSGLVLVAKTYLAYYNMRLDLNVGIVDRDYLVLSHGHVPPALTEIVAPVRWTPKSTRPSSVSPMGKPSRTRLKVLGHLRRQEEKLSLVAIRIDTGRQHQIRVHMAHVGHPTVCDAKYGTSHFQSDLHWCERNFLHRYRLGFPGQSGEPHEVVVPLPADLLFALGGVQAISDLSETNLKHCFSGGSLRSWEALPALHG